MSKPFIINSFEGGLNVSDSPNNLMEDQVMEAENIELSGASCGSKRLGHDAISLPAAITSLSGVVKMHHHRVLPTADLATDDGSAELWVLGATFNTSAILAYRNNTAWTTVSLIDTPTLTAADLTQVQFQSLHGKLFVAYNSGVNRLHVWDGTTFRRCGLGPPGPPTGADTAPAGTFSGVRYYRVRYTVQSGGTTILRSEPSTALTFTPLGTRTGATITKPASTLENETHWELEASIDNSNFYRIATTVVGTTTYTDTVAYTTGYASNPLSDDIGDYSVLPSPKFLAADNDRLLIAGSWEDVTQASRVTWTPTQKDVGVGNDERRELDLDPFLDLDTYEGGPITGMVANNGVVYVFKQSHTYRLVRTGQAQAAYEAVLVSKDIGAIPGSIVTAFDAAGYPAVFFIDEVMGPYMIGSGGMIKVGADIDPIWDSHETDGTPPVLVRGIYYPKKHQIRWVFTEVGFDYPSLGITLHLDSMVFTQTGYRKGWTVFSGGLYGSRQITDMILFAENVDSVNPRSTVMKPFVSFYGSGSPDYVLMGDTGTLDNGAPYLSSLISRPLMLNGGANKFGIRAGLVLGTTSDGSDQVGVSLIRDFGLEETSIITASFVDVTLTTTHTLAFLDNLCMSDARAIQIRLSDLTDEAAWEVHQIVLVPRTEDAA